MTIVPLNREPKTASDSDRTKPHVLLVIDQLAKTLGGGERIVLKLAAELPHYGYRASILTFRADPASPALQAPPCPVYLLPLDKTYDLAALRAAVALRKFLKEQHVRIVQTFFESSDIWAGLVTKTLSSAKLIWSRRDMGILRTAKHHAMYRLMAGLPDAVVAVSDQVQQYCIDVDHIDSARVHTIHNGLDLAGWSAIRNPTIAQSPTVVTVGNVRHVKGHDVFIRAAAKVAERFPDTSFSIAGEVLEQPYFADLQSLIRDLGLENNFHFAGGVTDLKPYLAAADIFVLPSRSEGFSNAIVEAMAACLPVIATSVGGNAEAVSAGLSGIVIPPEDADALAGAILKLLEDPPLARQMGETGKRLAAEKFTTQAMMQKTTAIYERLLVE